MWAYCNVIDSCCREIIRLRGKYRTTSEAIIKSTINAIILLILRSFQKKGCAIVAYRLKALPLNAVKYGNIVIEKKQENNKSQNKNE